MKFIKKTILPVLACCIIAMILTNSDKTIEYMKMSLGICGNIIIPTLFPFFICSGILIYSGFCETVSRLFRFCMRPLFGVNPMGAAAFVMGIISGYPLGAVTAGQLYESSYISKTEAERLCSFCNNSGPLFVIGSVGAAVYGNIRVGVILYVIHILSALTVGICFRFYKHSDYIAPNTEMTYPERSAGEIISIALKNAVSNMLTVCGAVIFFGTVGRMTVDLLPVEGVIYSLAAGLIEFVNGTVSTAGLNIDINSRLVMTAFIIGFGGLSVHAQVVAVIAKYRLSLIPYFLGMLLHGVFAAIYTFLYLFLCPYSVTVFAPTADRAVSASAFCVLAAAAAAVITGLIFYRTEK